MTNSTTNHTEMFGWAGRIGLIVPANNSLIEPELWSVMPEGVSLHATRVHAKGDMTPEAVRQNTAHALRAADELAQTEVDIIAYADMAPTFIMEPGWNDAKNETVNATFGTKCTTAWVALQAALGALEARSIALLTPYPSEIHALAVPYLRQTGYTLTDDKTLDIRGMRDVPCVDRTRILEAVSGLDLENADALVILATDLPTFSVIEEIEKTHGVPVVTSNQTLLWHTLRSVGNESSVGGLGQLLRNKTTRIG